MLLQVSLKHIIYKRLHNMNMGLIKTILALIILSHSSSSLFGQKYSVNGYVKDLETSELLIGANVFSANNFGSVTNNFGFFSLELKDTASIYISYTGYTQQLIRIQSQNDTNLTIFLQPGLPIDEVLVTAKHIRRIEDIPEIGTVNLSRKIISLTPSIMGESNLLKTAQFLPGIMPGSEGSSAIYVRGGSPDQNIVLLDDAHIYYLNHSSGVFSIFNTDAISSVNIIKGGFPARYGGRLSSVMDIRMRDGNLKEHSFSGQVGIMSIKGLVEGPIIKDKASFLISARRSFLDLIFAGFTYLKDGVSYGSSFYDINAKLNYIITPKNRIFFSYYSGNDKFYAKTIKNKSDFAGASNSKMIWGNRVSSLRWNRIVSNKLFANTSLIYTKYKLGYNSEASITDVYTTASSYQYYLEDFGGKIDIEHSQNHWYKARYGSVVLHHVFSPGTMGYYTQNGSSLIDTSFSYDKTYSIEYVLYTEQEIRLGSRFSSNLGLHYSNYLVNTNTFNSLEPRIILNYRFLKRVSLKASYSKMAQYIHLLANTGSGMPSDLWIPANSYAPPERSELLSLGIAGSIHANYEFSIEGYYKTMQELIEYSEGESFYSGEYWTSSTETGGFGEVRGVELLFKKNAGDLTGWIGYAYSQNNRKFDNINYGEKYAFRYDRPHEINIMLNYKLSEKIYLNATWQFYSGHAVTLPEGKFPASQLIPGLNTTLEQDVYADFAHTYSGKNKYRMESYHRLDIGINRTIKKDWGEHTWNFSIYNAYNRMNPSYYQFYLDEGKLSLYKITEMPFIPSLSWAVKF